MKSKGIAFVFDRHLEGIPFENLQEIDRIVKGIPFEIEGDCLWFSLAFGGGYLWPCEGNSL